MASRTDRPVTGLANKCPHGSKYNQGCRCQACRNCNAMYQKRYRRKKAEEAWGKIADSTRCELKPVRDIIKHQHDKNKIDFAELGRITGLKMHTVWEIYHGNRDWVSYGTTRKVIDTLTLDGKPVMPRRKYHSNQLIPAEEWVWKVRALMAQGWTTQLLRERLQQAGRPYRFIHDGLCGGQYVRFKNYEQIQWLVDTIGDQHGPSHENKGKFRKWGYYPLIHYTEDGKLLVNSIART